MSVSKTVVLPRNKRVMAYCALLQLLLLTAPFCTALAAEATEAKTFKQVLQTVIENYPNLQTTALQVQKAGLQSVKIQERLAWQLNASAGASNEAALFGGGYTQLQLGASVNRRLRSGDLVGVQAGVRREDYDNPFGPTMANPATISNAGISYRKPLKGGAGFQEFESAMNNAEAGFKIAQANRQNAYDNVALQLMDIYFSAIATQARVDNIHQSLSRTQRLQKFIRSRVSLGIAENKDQLQVAAQLDSQAAQLKLLNLAWIQQRIALNRLMGLSWDQELKIQTDKGGDVAQGGLAELVKEAGEYAPGIKVLNAQIDVANSNIAMIQDSNQDNLDLVLSLGNQYRAGDSAMGSVSDNELIGGVKLEYKHNSGKKGKQAALDESRLQRDIAERDKQQFLRDLEYDVASLVGEIQAIEEAIKAYEKSAASEQAKLKEADQRYRRGRIDIDRLIGFENQLSAAELALDLQDIEMKQRLLHLALKRGRLWQDVKIPQVDAMTP